MTRDRARGLALALGTLVSACVQRASLAQPQHAIALTADKARALGARACAPEELALALAHLRFAALEQRHGDQARAREHLALAELNAHAALILSGADCASRVPERAASARSTATPAGLAPTPSANRAYDAARNCAQVHASHTSATTLGRQRDPSAVDPRVEAASPRPPT